MLHCTTSWDDGHPLDLRIADLLLKYNIPGTFFVPILNSENKPTLTKKQILNLSKQFKIGGHTYSHRELTALSHNKALIEIKSGKEALEQIIESEITEFCYPRGKYSTEVEALVRSAGFTRARSARLFSVHGENTEFTYHPNLHWYPHSTLIRSLHCLKQHDIESLSCVPKTIHRSLSEVAAILSVSNNEHTIHIWGHSWEVVELGLLPELELFFKTVAES